MVVTENLMGDIITDLAAMTSGGMGVASGGNLNPTGLSMFEPIGGVRRSTPAGTSSTRWPQPARRR